MDKAKKEHERSNASPAIFPEYQLWEDHWIRYATELAVVRSLFREPGKKEKSLLNFLVMTAFKRGLCYILYGLIKKRTTSEQHSVREQLKASIGERTNALCPPHPTPGPGPCRVVCGPLCPGEQFISENRWLTASGAPWEPTVLPCVGGEIFATDSLKSYPLPFLNP